MFRNLPRRDYLGLLRTAEVIVGNSSSGLLEAPTFGLPCVNIGRRQNRRPQAANVINCGYDSDEIKNALNKALSLEFKAIAKASNNPYGDGRSGERIVEVLKNISIDQKLLNKEMTY
jgi:UDP-N-acetylglucosamine 2-epimerase